jgi:hypothetical protein
MERSRLARICGILPLAVIVMLKLQVAAFAQEVNEEYILQHLGPAAEEMQWAGLDGSGESTPAMIAIGQRWGIDPAYWVSVDEARMLVRADREDGDVRSRYASLQNPLDKYPSRVLVARFGVVTVGLTCGQAQEKARTAQRLADTLSRVSQLNAVGAGLVGAISQGAVRFVAPMAFATMVTGFASAWAGQLAAGYRNAPCLAGGQLWRFRPNVLKTTFFQDLSRTPPSSHGRHGWRFAALLTGAMSRRPVPASPFCCRLASGRSRSS